MRKSIAADYPTGTAKPPRSPRYGLGDRVRLDPGNMTRVVVGRTQVNGLWVYDCVRAAAAGPHPNIAICEHLLCRAD